MEKPRERSFFLTVLLLILFFVPIWFFSYWGYQWVLYLLGKLFEVDTKSTIFDLFVGLIAMASAVPVFIGATKVWRWLSNYSNYFLIGVIGFITKNILEIINVIYKLYLEKEKIVSIGDLNVAATFIGIQMFQLAFWAFVLIFFNKYYPKFAQSQETGKTETLEEPKQI